MGLLNLSRARQIAEAEWGVGGTTYYETNRAGAFWFSCSGHGGFVVDRDCLSQDELDSLAPFLDVAGRVIMAEEDVCWALIVKFCDIRRLKDDEATVKHYAEATWESDFNPESPKVIAANIRRKAIEDKCPDTIISAYPECETSVDLWSVTTGNFQRYRVSGYAAGKTSLNDCIVLETVSLED